MPSGWNANTPNDVIFEAGVLSIEIATVQTDIGITRGGVHPEFGDEWRHFKNFDGGRTRIAGMSRIVDSAPVITGVMLQLDETMIQQVAAGTTKVTVAGPPAVHTLTPPKRSTVVPKTAEVKNPRIRYTRSGGGFVDFKAPYALGVFQTLNARDKDEGEIPFRFEAGIDPAAVGFTTDDPAFTMVVTDPTP